GHGRRRRWSTRAENRSRRNAARSRRIASRLQPGPPPPTLELGPPPLRRQPPLARRRRRLGGPPPPRHSQRRREPRAQPLERQLAVPRLRARVLSDGHDPRPGPCPHTALLLLAQGVRRLDVEDRREPRGRHVRVLAARSRRAARTQLDL